jgi:hypothetical protein
VDPELRCLFCFSGLGCTSVLSAGWESESAPTTSRVELEDLKSAEASERGSESNSVPHGPEPTRLDPARYGQHLLELFVDLFLLKILMEVQAIGSLINHMGRVPSRASERPCCNCITISPRDASMLKLVVEGCCCNRMSCRKRH